MDENIPIPTVTELRNLGHDVLDVRGTPDQGSSDDIIWKLAQNQRRLFVTTDKGFVSHRDETHFGILVIRLRQPTLEKIHVRIMKAIQQFTEAEWPGTLVVVRDTVQSVWKMRQRDKR